jgi:hypothetical protein
MQTGYSKEERYGWSTSSRCFAEVIRAADFVAWGFFPTRHTSIGKSPRDPSSGPYVEHRAGVVRRRGAQGGGMC